MYRHVLTAAALFVVLAALLLACSDNGDLRRVSLAPDPAQHPPSAGGETPLRVAVAAVVSPERSFVHYRELADYLGQRLGRPARLVQRRTYAEVNALLAEGGVEVAFVCSGAYVEGAARNEQRLLAVPVIDGETTYRAAIIVSRDNPAASLADLRGGRFAFTDPLSNTGYRSPVAMIRRLGSTPAAFFRQTVFTHSHDRSIEAVARGVVDGASVDSLVLAALQRQEPEITRRVKVIELSEPYGIPPVVTPVSLDETTYRRLQETLLTMADDPTGQAILAALGMDRFVTADDHLYDSVRALPLPAAELP